MRLIYKTAKAPATRKPVSLTRMAMSFCCIPDPCHSERRVEQLQIGVAKPETKSLLPDGQGFFVATTWLLRMT